MKRYILKTAPGDALDLTNYGCCFYDTREEAQRVCDEVKAESGGIWEVSPVTLTILASQPDADGRDG